jgi:hypothetical protein
MTQPTVFERNRNLARPPGRAAWNESFGPVLAELRDALRRSQPEQVAHLSGAEWDAQASELRLAWLGTCYRIPWPELVTYPAGGGDPCPVNVQGLFLYYLATADGCPSANTWVAFRDLPDGWLYHQAFQGYTGHVLVQALGNEISPLEEAARALGGEVLAVSDCGHAFQVLPRVRLAVVYWQGDEEFEPRAQVLFDAAAGHYLPIDGLALLGSDLVRRLLSMAQKE